MEILDRAAALRSQHQQAALVTVVDASGSTPRKAGSRMLVYPDGSIEGTVGGGRVEYEVQNKALDVLRAKEPMSIRYDLTKDLGMGCGGEMTFFIEPLLTQPLLIVFGCGHVGTAVIRLASSIGFDVIAIDDLSQHASHERLPEAKQVIASYDPEDLAELPYGDDAYILIVTREHAFDQQMLELCINRNWRYIGVIGSMRKARAQRERLAELGIAPERIDAVHCPVGLDIGAQTPEEIAVAICAQLIEVRRGGRRFTEKA